ncbi:unnamed protein product (macronuclear) [Paramecium tetraurelia]|uniref:Cytochrome c domain-containing protein n=1 Tax=Paramecium tetraurelia TaxID=5888 RepID=A0C3K0_PARTE|nr:uncharacterized protein GSPATT00034846001 [Paramecium tetraurelia]CAK65367.1 unnamed protein product [Paramecium tetraurelia]|eukprot:XP_001432764.1 hypothetical protein (macronuclear) [Paramecium tetraurelia strain d4-2]
MRSRRLSDGEFGYELHGSSNQKYRRKGQVKNEDEIEIEVPNGNLTKGRIFFSHNCAGCHVLENTHLIQKSIFKFMTILENCVTKKKQVEEISNYGKNLTDCLQVLLDQKKALGIFRES